MQFDLTAVDRATASAVLTGGTCEFLDSFDRDPRIEIRNDDHRFSPASGFFPTQDNATVCGRRFVHRGFGRSLGKAGHFESGEWRLQARRRGGNRDLRLLHESTIGDGHRSGEIGVDANAGKPKMAR